MGKSRRHRTKLHTPSKNVQNKFEEYANGPSLPMEVPPSSNVFAALNINVDSLNTNLSDDTKTVKSTVGDKILLKKDKLKLRRELLLKKLDIVNQIKKERSFKQKKSDTTRVSAANPLRDALPSLERLLKSNSSTNDLLSTTKTFKSLKSEASEGKILSKKDKIKLRKELLQNKIEVTKQNHLESNLRQRRKNTSLIGDTNPLRDALPSLDSLLKSNKCKTTKCIDSKPKGIEKAVKRKKTVIEGVNLFKKVMSDKHFQQNCMATIRQHLQAVVDNERERLNIKSIS